MILSFGCMCMFCNASDATYTYTYTYTYTNTIIYRYINKEVWFFGRFTPLKFSLFCQKMNNSVEKL